VLHTTKVDRELAGRLKLKDVLALNVNPGGTPVVKDMPAGAASDGPVSAGCPCAEEDAETRQGQNSAYRMPLPGPKGVDGPVTVAHGMELTDEAVNVPIGGIVQRDRGI
jgi:hypothetical protein